MNLFAIFADTRPACYAVRTLAHGRSLRLSRLASLPAEADGPIYLVGSYAHDNEPVENFPGPEGRAQASVQLPAHSALSLRIRGRFYGAG